MPGQCKQRLGGQRFAGAFGGLAAAVFQLIAAADGAFGQTAEVLLYRFQGLAGVHVADNNQSGVIRRIPTAVPIAQIGGGELIQISAVADDGRPQIGQAVGGKVEFSHSLPPGSSSLRIRRSSLITFISLAKSRSLKLRLAMRSASSFSTSSRLRTAMSVT